MEFVSIRKPARIDQNIRRLLACVFFGGLVSTSAVAQGTQDACPKGYSIFETVCLDEVTGDIVNQLHAKANSDDPASASSAAGASGKTSATGTTGR